MRLGIDFGTTRIAVAAVDRGNYPIVTFEASDGDVWEWFPPLLAVSRGEWLYGWEAWRAQKDPQATTIRSIKRLLQDAGPETKVEVGWLRIPMLELLTGLTQALHKALLERSSLTRSREPLEVMVGVPANANVNQRFLTMEAFRRAGFEVLGLLNEPSAASIEFGHARRQKSQAGSCTKILVYDLGGGTFDASLVELDEQTHSVIASDGIPTLGGDDFDEILAEMATQASGFSASEHNSLAPADLFWLHEECRGKKEALHPNSKRINIDLDVMAPGWDSVSIPVTGFYERCQPLIDQTIQVVERLLSSHDGVIEVLYVTGGGSELPLVSRALREVFGARVRRSAYTRFATAIGLAIQADAQAGYQLRDRFTRNFGVWREADCGRDITFDPLFLKGTPLPAPGQPPLQVARRYRPAHNIGHFRYLESSHLGKDGLPAGDISVWDQVLFPFDPALHKQMELTGIPIARWDWAASQEVVEDYCCDTSGAVLVTISNTSAGYERKYRLGRWAASDGTLVAGRKKRGPVVRK